MTLATNNAVDVGVKVMRLPIRVTGTGSPDEVLFERAYGFGYAGSMTNAATFKELIAELLINVQYLRDPATLSFERICEFIARYSEKVSTEVCAHLYEKGGYTFFLAGWCPLEKRLRGALFTLSQDAGKSIAKYEDVAASDGDYKAVGSGAREVGVILSGRTATMRSVLQAINQVIDEGKVDSVGGDLQYGSFDKSGNFACSGFARMSMEQCEHDGKTYGPSQQVAYRYRGFQLYGTWSEDEGGFWPTAGFINLDVPSNAQSKQRFLELILNASSNPSEAAASDAAG